MYIDVKHPHKNFKELIIKYDSVTLFTNWLNETEADNIAWQLISAGCDLLTDGRFDNYLKKLIIETILE